MAYSGTENSSDRIKKWVATINSVQQINSSKWLLQGKAYENNDNVVTPIQQIEKKIINKWLFTENTYSAETLKLEPTKDQDLSKWLPSRKNIDLGKCNQEHRILSKSPSPGKQSSIHFWKHAKSYAWLLKDLKWDAHSGVELNMALDCVWLMKDIKWDVHIDGKPNRFKKTLPHVRLLGNQHAPCVWLLKDIKWDVHIDVEPNSPKKSLPCVSLPWNQHAPCVWLMKDIEWDVNIDVEPNSLQKTLPRVSLLWKQPTQCSWLNRKTHWLLTPSAHGKLC